MANKIGSIYFTLGLDATEFEKKLSAASARMADFGKRAQDAGRRMSMYLTLPIVSVGTAAANMAMGFEESMSRIEGLVGIAGGDVEKMGVTVRQMAKEFGKSANEAAEALYFITSAGLRGKDAMDTLEASLKASTVGLGETKTVADLATSALNAYGAANLSATQATDVMVATIREGKLETNELALSMGRVLPIASAMGVQFNEVGAAFAALSRTGTNASEAATQLRGILSALLNPSGLAATELERLGLSGQMIRDTIRQDGLLAALEMLTKAFEGNDESAGIVFGNIRALSGVLDLFGKNVDTTRQIFANMADSAGDLSAAFAVTEQTARFRLNKAIAESKDGMISLGNAVLTLVLPIIERLSSAIQRLGDWFGGLDPSMQALIVTIGGLTAALGPLLIGLGAVLQMMPMLSTAFTFLAVTPLGALIVAIGAAAAAFAVFASSANVIQSIAPTTGEALNKLGGSYTALKDAIAKVKDVKDGIVKSTPEELQALKAVASAKYQEAEATLAQAIAEKELLKARINAQIQEKVSSGDAAFGMEIIGLKQDLKDLDQTIADTEMLKADLTAQMKNLDIAFDGYNKKITTTTAATKDLTEAQKKHLALGDGLKQLFSGKALDGLNRSLDAVFPKMTKFFEMVYGKSQEGQDTVFDRLGSQIVSAINDANEDPALKALFNSLNQTGEAAGAMASAFGSMASAVGSSIQGVAGQWVSFVGKMIAEIIRIIAAAKAASLAQSIQGATAAGAATGPASPFTTPAFIASAIATIAGAFAAIPKFAKGGAVTGPTLAMVGENPASRGEAIIPFERMGSFLNQIGINGGAGVQNIVVSGQLAGDVIRLSGEKSAINNGRVRWGRGTALVNT